MLARLTEKLLSYRDRVSVVKSDLSIPFGIDRQCDALTSVATFHWVKDRHVLFHNLKQTLKPNGLFVADCGGFGNIERIFATFSDVTKDEFNPAEMWSFAAPQKTSILLENCGFEKIDVTLVKDPIPSTSRSQFDAFLSTVVLGALLDGYEQLDREKIVTEVIDLLGSFRVDFVRLRMRANVAGGA